MKNHDRGRNSPKLINTQDTSLQEWSNISNIVSKKSRICVTVGISEGNTEILTLDMSLKVSIISTGYSR